MAIGDGRSGVSRIRRNIRFTASAALLYSVLSARTPCMEARGSEVATRTPNRGQPTTSSKESISRLAFGSCNRQYLPQPMWRRVEELEPDLWLWIGDAVYVDKFSDGGVDKVREALATQLADKDYQRFLSKVPRVEGVWDDHDYGVNDAGKTLPDHAGRVAEFLDFLGAAEDDPRRGGATLYASHVFGEAPKQVKVLTLDLRTQRDDYYAFNIAHRRFKLAAILGALLRWFSSSFCLGSDHDGSIIGEEQWEWLEGQLTDSEASVHVLVSTLQVLTSNPLVESWGHFPRSRKRLLDLLRRTSPKGLVILSGDVHHAELISGWQASPPPRGNAGRVSVLPENHPPLNDGSGGGRCPFARQEESSDAPPKMNEEEESFREAGDDRRDAPVRERADECAAHVGGGRGRGVVEVTSSGMTHSCVSTHGRRVCKPYLERWTQHRWREDAYYLEQNFGDIAFEWAEDENAPQPAKMTVTVRDLNSTAILPVVEHFGDWDEGDGRHRDARDDVPAATTSTPFLAEEGLERTFLDRSPPSECVKAVLPGGCTVRRVVSLLVTIVILAISWLKMARALLGLLKSSGATERVEESGGGVGSGGVADEGPRNGTGMGSGNGSKNRSGDGAGKGNGHGSGNGSRTKA